MVRCPYLYNSDELKLFIRPHQDIDRSLALLPKLSSSKLFEKVSPYYSLLGDIDLSALQSINTGVNQFCQQCKHNLVFLDKFKNQVLEMEKGFDYNWGSNSKLNRYFYQYEREVLTGHIQVLE